MPFPNYYKTSDGSQLYLHYKGSGAGYEMWDGDGNLYTFDWNVTGYADIFDNYVFDLGRGRNGWYLKSLTDPFNNSITVSYKSGGSQPCWTPSHCPSGTNSWIIDTVKRGARRYPILCVTGFG